MKPKKYYPPLLPGRFFHVFNRGNNGDNLFYQERNYAYFLRKYFEYMSPVLDTYCYCLLPNHFHLLVRVKEEAVVLGDKKGAMPGDKRDSIPTLGAHWARDGIPTPGHGASRDDREKEAALWVSERFRRLFLGYSQAIRKQEGRTGSLFQKNFIAHLERVNLNLIDPVLIEEDSFAAK
ncbi:MAG: hypothetical protein H6556_29570 [Lewinellaceae bacterium]|nr:hypothetical protein [Lewinellaceae bacterium]